MKEYFCIGSYLPFDSINKSQLNNSTAKQAFSFSKSKRFNDYKTNCNIAAYSSNQFKLRNQGAKIGLSKRQPFVKISDNPSPSHYKINTEPFSSSISFGLSRQHIRASNYLNIEAKKFPSSTKYKVEYFFKNLCKKPPVYSMRKKYPRQKIEDASPGPAQYQILVGKNQNLSLTKYKSVSFSTGKSRRFENSFTESPGPGAYQQFNFNEKDLRIGGGNSRFHSSLTAKFPHAQRKTYIDDETYLKLSLPGPGNYKVPSQFGQYDGQIYKTFEITAKRRNEQVHTDSELRSNYNHGLNRPKTSKC